MKSLNLQFPILAILSCIVLLIPIAKVSAQCTMNYDNNPGGMLNWSLINNPTRGVSQQIVAECDGNLTSFFMSSFTGAVSFQVRTGNNPNGGTILYNEAIASGTPVNGVYTLASPVAVTQGQSYVIRIMGNTHSGNLNMNQFVYTNGDFWYSLNNGSSWNSYGADIRFIVQISPAAPPEPAASIKFDGSNDYVQGGNITVPIQEKTMSAWVKLGSTTQQGGSVVTLETSTGALFDGIVYNEIGQGWGFGSDYFNRTAWSGVTESSTTEWVHIAATYKNNDYRLYRNGVQIFQTTVFPAAAFSSGSPRVLVGKRHTGVGGNGYLNAAIDEVQVWDRVLCEEEIQHMMNCELTGSESGLVVYYKFNNINATSEGNNAGQTTLTNSAGGNNGTLLNFALSGSTSNWIAPGAVTSGVSCTPIAANICYKVWNGSNSTAWNTASNWNGNSVPNSCSDDVIINLNLPNNPVINSSVYVGDITMTGNGSLALNANITVCGDVSNGNTGLTGVGTLIMQGASAQTIDGNLSAEKLRVDNVAGVTVTGGSTITVGSALELKTGTLSSTTPIVLASTASGTAYLDNFSAGFSGSYSGQVTMERYVSTSGFHHLGAAVGISDIASQLSEANLSGPNMGQVIPLATCDPSSIDGTSPYGNMFEWHENASFLFNCTQSGWFVRSTGAMQAGRGYTLNRNAGTTFDLTGTPHLNTITYGPLGNTNAMGNGFHMVSNPYPSDIEYVSPISGFDAAIYVWQSTGQYAGTYQSSFPGSGTRIASQQAYFARKSSGSGNYSIPLSWRRTGNTTYFREADNGGLEIIVKGHGFSDRTQINFNDMASKNFESDVDAFKLDNGNVQPQLASSNGYENFSVNTLNIDGEEEIPLVFKTGIEGEYKLEFNTEKEGFWLEDKHLDVFRPITENYTFTSTENDEDRFVIHARMASTAGNSDEEQIVIFTTKNELSILNAKEGIATIELLDMMGRVVFATNSTLSQGKNQVQLPTVSKGQYVAKVSTSKSVASKKVIL